MCRRAPDRCGRSVHRRNRRGRPYADTSRRRRPAYSDRDTIERGGLFLAAAGLVIGVNGYNEVGDGCFADHAGFGIGRQPADKFCSMKTQQTSSFLSGEGRIQCVNRRLILNGFVWEIIEQKLDKAGLRVDRNAIEAAAKKMSGAALEEIMKAFTDGEDAE